jgi:hypothetical protein
VERSIKRSKGFDKEDANIQSQWSSQCRISIKRGMVSSPLVSLEKAHSRLIKAINELDYWKPSSD